MPLIIGEWLLKKEYYVVALKCNEIMELLSDTRLLKTMLNDGSGYPMLMKEFMANNGGIHHGLLISFISCLLVKDIIDTVLHIYAHVNEPDILFMEKCWSCVTSSC